jgi:tetratricopeptide (TPR) repeat protein
MMARASAQKKASGVKARQKAKSSPGSSGRKSARQSPEARRTTPTARKGRGASAAKRPPRRTAQKGVGAKATERKKAGVPAVSHLPQPEVQPPRLLRESRATSAALSILEKAIKLIYQKDFRKARLELESLVSDYASEPEITARARSYLHICQREEGTRPKSAASSDELYSVGVLEHNRGNYDAAIGYFRQCLERRSDADFVLYSLAASLALKGDAEAAIQNLKRAIELNEENRVYAKNDSDFTSLHSRQDYLMLLRLSTASGG